MTTTGSRLLVCLLLLVGFFVSPAQAQDDGQVVDEIAAVVGQDLILRSEVDAIVQNRLRRNPQINRSKEALWKSVLNQLIDQKVLAIHAGSDTTITVTSSQVAQQLDRRIEQMSNQVGGKDQLEKMYGKSISELRAQFRGDFRNQLLAQQLRARKMRDVSVTPSEIKDWYEGIPTDSLPRIPTAVQLAHIVRYPKPSKAARRQARDVISGIRDSVINGRASFEKMARRYSEDEGSASYGGRMKDYKLDDLLPEFAAVATQLHEGEISQVFETPLGFHIMRLNKRSGDNVDFNHILIKIEEDSGDNQTVRDFLSAVRDSITSGAATFEEMARRYSEQDESARRGGQVVAPRTGQRELVLDRLNDSWKETIRDLGEGEISQPTQVQLLDGDEAFHIVKLQKNKPAHRLSLKTDYDRIHQLALRQKKQRVFRRWAKKLRKDVYVDIHMKPDEFSLAQF